MNILFKLLLILACAAPGTALAQDAFEALPISYSETAPDNPIEGLRTALESGAATRAPEEEGGGYLRPLLKLLGIPESSQVLVFSKTSLQINNISPAAPRAIYFNDDVYIGSVQHSDVLEISAADPKLGAVFYTLAPGSGARPEITRQRHECLQCHGGTMTRNMPGHIVRSVFPADDGQPIMKAGSTLTDDTTPLEDRWGGWYITGTHGDARHRGNQIATETQYDATIDVEAGANQPALPPRVNTADYLTPHSDIVAMMVLEHQAQMHNLMTQASFETRMALYRQALMDKIFDRAPDVLSESTQRIIKSAGDALVEYMIFAHEIELESPIEGTSGFTATFPAQGPRDSQGRSLRDFDLKSRLFTYPLSYLIYSPQFDGLPDPMKNYVYQRLWNILTGVESTPDWLYLTNAKCRAIREILIETKPGLPAYWVK
jgi:hypothetical protein